MRFKDLLPCQRIKIIMYYPLLKEVMDYLLISRPIPRSYKISYCIFMINNGILVEIEYYMFRNNIIPSMVINNDKRNT
jgi:hypothetical protein